MTIKDLIKRLESTPNKDRDVYIPHREIIKPEPTDTEVCYQDTTSTSIGVSYDDNNDVEMYVVSDK